MARTPLKILLLLAVAFVLQTRASEIREIAGLRELVSVMQPVGAGTRLHALLNNNFNLTPRSYGTSAFPVRPQVVLAYLAVIHQLHPNSSLTGGFSIAQFNPGPPWTKLPDGTSEGLNSRELRPWLQVQLQTSSRIWQLYTRQRYEFRFLEETTGWERRDRLRSMAGIRSFVTESWFTNANVEWMIIAQPNERTSLRRNTETRYYAGVGWRSPGFILEAGPWLQTLALSSGNERWFYAFQISATWNLQ